MSPIPPSAFLTTALPSPHWPPGPSSQSIPTTRPRGLITLTPARPRGCTLPSLTWGPPRGPCTPPSPTRPACRSHIAPRTGNSPSTRLCRGHDRQRDQRALAQVPPPCQTRGAAAPADVLVAAGVEVGWSGGSGRAPGESAVETGGERPRSAPAQIQKCRRRPRLSMRRGAFQAWSIIWGNRCKRVRVNHFTPSQSFELDRLQPRLSPPQTRRLTVFTSGLGSCPCQFCVSEEALCRLRHSPTGHQGSAAAAEGGTH